MKHIFFILLMLMGGVIYAQNDVKDSIDNWSGFPNYGNEYRSAAFFGERYLHNNWTHYLDNLNDFVCFEQETTGSFDLPDAQVFSIGGNSFRSNKYYVDGFRLNSRFASGSTFYRPDLSLQGMTVNYYRSAIEFTSERMENSAAVSYNIGGIGGISPGTADLIHLFHRTASDAVYKDSPLSPITHRNRMKGSGTLTVNYAVPAGEQQYAQHLYADFGTRLVSNFGEKGITELYPEDFLKVQLSGELPLTLAGLFDRTAYIAGITQRDNLYNEFYFGKDETARHNMYSVSFYGTKKTDKTNYTSGFTLAVNNTRHQNINYSRNLIDQDGEGFEPYYPDAAITEFSHALNYERTLTPHLKFKFESYNSLIYSSPHQRDFYNPAYAQMIDSTPQSLYVYEWHTAPFASGLLDNVAGIQWHSQPASWLDLRADVDVTLDAMLIADKSMLRPNWQAQAGVFVHPTQWFAMEINLSKKRVEFNFDDIRYFSNDYLHGEVYYWKNAETLEFSEDQKSDLLYTTGGKYHSAAGGLRQTSYFVFDLPLYFSFGKHEISILNSYRKYYNNWITRFDKPAEEYGRYEDNVSLVYSGEEIHRDNIFIYDGGKPINYVVDYYTEADFPGEGVSNNFENSTPYYASNTIKYQYTSAKFMFSLAWQSYMMSGISTLGNGPLHNNLGVYSETSANPNIRYKNVGRLNQDKAYVARMQLSYRPITRLAFTLIGKFKDGQPFTHFATRLATDGNDNTQLLIVNGSTKGINPYDDDFGVRDDGFFNFDFITSFTGKIGNHTYQLQAMVYNLYDFGTELTEYTFAPPARTEGAYPGGRFSLSMCIPRGLMITAKVNF
ncbi:hypothetical protein AGMMS4956_17520 [Bacteroidia bacterium]|nr:hypothetical protein AGMMS4956_17520 [Bacteroidia bacterium]